MDLRLRWPLLALTFVGLAAALGCVHPSLDRSEPIGTPVRVRLDDVPVNGFKVEVDFQGEEETESEKGELLAVDATRLWVARGERWLELPRPCVRLVELYDMYDAGSEALWVWTALGTVSSLSHGLFAVFSGPGWLVGGGATALAAEQGNDRDVQPFEFDRLSQFARFPQGLPATARPATLRRVSCPAAAAVPADEPAAPGAEAPAPPPAAPPPAETPQGEPGGAEWGEGGPP